MLRNIIRRLRAAYHSYLERASLLAELLAFEVELRLLKIVRREPIRLAIEIDRTNIGLFAELNWVLYLILYARSVDAEPSITIGSKTYSGPSADQSDWLGQLFDTWWRIPEPGGRHATIRRSIRSLSQLPYFQARVGSVSLLEANAVVQTHLRPLPHIMEAVERFVDAHLGGNYVAIHWRGTDKIGEAPAVTSQEVVDKTQVVIRNMQESPQAIFVASDDQHLIEQLSAAFAVTQPGIPLVTRTNAIRSLDGKPIHLHRATEPKDRLRMGEDAVIDCLLLSRASVLVRTASFLSGWASVFSPELPVYMLNRPYAHCNWFPDREVALLSDFHEQKLTISDPSSAVT